MSKILVVAPTSEIKDYIVYDYISLIKNLNYDNYDIFIVDNSSKSRTIWEELGIKSQWVNPKGKSQIEVICESQNIIRDYFLANPEYTHLLFIESDLLPSPDCLSLLLMHNKPVVGFPYFIYKWEDTKPMIIQSNDTLFKDTLETRLLELEEHFSIQDGTLKKAHSVGFGCTLIERWVLEKIKFRLNKSEYMHSDSFFYEDCYVNRIPVYVDTSMLVPHYNSAEIL